MMDGDGQGIAGRVPFRNSACLTPDLSHTAL